MKKWGEFLAIWNGSAAVVLIASVVLESAKMAYGLPPGGHEAPDPYGLAITLFSLIGTFAANAVYFALASRKFEK